MLNLITKIIREYVDIDDTTITPDTSFIVDLHLTSFDIVSMIGELESDLGIQIPDRQIRDLDTIGSLMKYLEDCLL